MSQGAITWIGDDTDNQPTFTAPFNHLVYGNGGNDLLDLSTSTAAYDHQVFGGTGHDDLKGGAGEDRLYGESGNDVLNGGGGDDVLDGGDGQDFLVGDRVGQVDGSDVLIGGLGDDSLEGNGGDDILRGGEGADWVLGDDDVFSPTRPVGEDYLQGDAGADKLWGGLGDDVLLGGDDADELYGDNVVSGPWREFFPLTGMVVTHPSGGASFFSPLGGADYLDGGAGNDFLQGDGGDDIVLGGIGDDVLYGDDQNLYTVQAGNDWLDGGDGNDTLVGGGGDDVLSGGAGTDTLLGDGLYAPGLVAGNDSLDGGAGNDILFGDGGDDVLSGGDGNDFLAGDDPNDTRVVGGNDVLYGEAGADQLQGGRGDDLLYGGDGNDVIFGDRTFADPNPVGGSDLLDGGIGDDQLYGDSGNDMLLGGDGNDTLVGGTGDDTLDGDAGNDTYVFNIGDGHDEISDTVLPFEGNSINFGPGISFTNLTLTEDPDQNTLTIQVGGSSDTITLLDFDPNGVNGSLVVQTLTFAAGGSVSLANLFPLQSGLIDGTAGNDVINATPGDDIIQGFAGNDTLSAGAGNDVLDGGAGDDTLIGGSGSNTYLFGIGYGHDTIQESNPFGIDINTIQLLEGIAPGDVVLEATITDGLVLKIAGAADDLTVSGFFSSPSNHINQIAFADGTVWDSAMILSKAQGFTMTGTAGPDVLTGTAANDALTGLGGNDTLNGLAGDDVLDGGPGTDTLKGGAGSDIYLLGRGSGQDTVEDTSFDQADIDTIQMAADVLPSDVAVTRGSAGLVLTINETDDKLTVTNFFLEGVNQVAQVQVQFADGTIWDSLTLWDKARRINGTDQSEVLTGFIRQADIINAGAGNDVLNGGDAFDIEGLIFSSGDDTLIGGPGSDTYIFNVDLHPYGPAGFGNDTIIDSSNASDTNTVVFGQGSSGRLSLGPDSVTLGFDPSGLLITVRNDPFNDDLFNVSGVPAVLGTVHIPNFNPTDAYGPHAIDTFEFADGTVMTYSQLLDKGFDLTGTAGNDTITGTSAPDRIDGGSGSDRMIGGLGNDTYVVDNAGDVVVEAFNEGIDTVISSINYVLYDKPNVENLTLTGFAGFGIGNALDNVLTGNINIAGNTLIGGQGNDTYVFGNLNLLGPMDIVIEDPNEGIDTVQTSRSYTLAANVENLTLTGTADIDGTGNALDNIITGNSANNILSGGAGNDTYVFNRGGGVDTIQDISTETEGNVLQFGPGINFSDLQFIQSGNLLTITVGENGDAVRLMDFDPAGINGSLVVTGLRFASVNVNNPPTVANAIADLTTAEDAPFSFIVPGNTFADPDTGDTLAYSATLGDDSPLPAWLSFNAATRTFSGTPDDAQVGTVSLKVTATDSGYLSAASTFALTITDVNEAPTVANAIADQSTAEDSLFSFVVPGNTFADPDAGDSLAYSATLGDDSPLPAWLSFDGTTRIFSGTPDDAQLGTLSLKVIATDSGALSASDTFVLTVTNVNEAPTVANAIADQSTAEDSLFSFVVPGNTFADPDAGDSLAYSATLGDDSPLPGWLAFDAATQTFSGTPDDAQVGTVSLKVSATDSGGLGASSIFALTITNVNEAPTVTNAIADQTTAEDAPFSFIVPGNTFVDPDAGDTLAYSATLGDDSPLPAWLAFDAATRTFSGTPDDADVGTISLKVTATDSGNLRAADVFGFTVTAVPNAVITGTPGNDTLIGTSGDDVIQGLGGNDMLSSLAGNDLLDGGVGADVLVGGAGDDTYVVDNAGDVVTENAGEGTDTVQSSITYSLGPNVENLTLLGSSAINGTGNALNNILTGNSGKNVLKGGAGNDTYIVSSRDSVVENANEGTDTVLSSVTFTLGANVENLTLVGSTAIDGTGNALSNVLTGNSAANVLDGGAGADALVGGAGDDTYVVDNAGDVVTENAGEGTDTVQSSIPYTLGANVENLTLTGNATINGTGNALDNVLTGNTKANVLTGGAGNDTYIVGARDTVVEVAGAGTDTVQSSVTFTLGANVENLTLTGKSAINGTGNSLNNTLTGNSANNTLTGGAGNDTYLYNRGGAQDTVVDNDSTAGNSDTMLFGSTINPMDLVLSRNVNNLRIAIHGSSDQVTIQNWYSGSDNQTEVIQADNGQTLVNTQVAQLIQAMATYSASSGLSWDQALDQRPQDVQTILAANWH